MIDRIIRDYRDGIITRREACRKLAAFGVDGERVL
jgi:hypothetical protein